MRSKTRKTLESLSRHAAGFTLLEILIVIIIVGILVAISIFRAGGAKQSALDASAKSDLRNMMTAQENYFTSTNAYVATSVPAGGSVDLNSDGLTDFSGSRQVSLQVTAYSNGIQITARHASSSNVWCVNSSATNASGGLGLITRASSC